MFTLTNKIAVITGGGSGIGRALALSLGREGAKLMLLDKDLEGLLGTQELLGPISDQCLVTQLDVREKDQLTTVGHDVKEKFGKVDILINSAGVNIAAKPFDQVTDEQWKWIVDINFWGTVNTIQVFQPLMKEDSVVVNLSSILGLAGMTNSVAYSTTKFAIRGLTESLAMELADSGIHFITVFPGAVRTNIIDNSWADEDNKRLVKSYVEKMGSVSVEKAASKIIKGIKRRKRRVLIGKDAIGLDLLTRLFPTGYISIILSRLNKMGLNE